MKNSGIMNSAKKRPGSFSQDLFHFVIKRLINSNCNRILGLFYENFKMKFID